MLFSVSPKHTAGKDLFAYWDGFLSKEDINQILAAPEWLNMNPGMVRGGFVDGKPIEDELNLELREVNVGWMHPNPSNLNIWQKMSTVVSEVNSKFFQFDLTGFYEPAQLGLYVEDKKSHYTWHTDTSFKDKAAPRKLSMILILSDPSEFEGGELQIKTNSDEPITLEQKQGRAWFFPSYMLHRVTPVTKGIRRSLVAWVGGPEFK